MAGTYTTIPAGIPAQPMQVATYVQGQAPAVQYGGMGIPAYVNTIPPQPPVQQYGNPTIQYGDPTIQYGSPTVQYGDPTVQLEDPTVQYGDPTIQYGDETLQGENMPRGQDEPVTPPVYRKPGMNKTLKRGLIVGGTFGGLALLTIGLIIVSPLIYRSLRVSKSEDLVFGRLQRISFGVVDGGAKVDGAPFVEIVSNSTALQVVEYACQEQLMRKYFSMKEGDKMSLNMCLIFPVLALKRPKDVFKLRDETIKIARTLMYEMFLEFPDRRTIISGLFQGLCTTIETYSDHLLDSSACILSQQFHKLDIISRSGTDTIEKISNCFAATPGSFDEKAWSSLKTRNRKKYYYNLTPSVAPGCPQRGIMVKRKQLERVKKGEEANLLNYLAELQTVDAEKIINVKMTTKENTEYLDLQRSLTANPTYSTYSLDSAGNKCTLQAPFEICRLHFDHAETEKAWQKTLTAVASVLQHCSHSLGKMTVGNLRTSYHYEAKYQNGHWIRIYR